LCSVPIPELGARRGCLLLPASGSFLVDAHTPGSLMV
jgi:hypothetical protein